MPKESKRMHLHLTLPEEIMAIVEKKANSLLMSRSDVIRWVLHDAFQEELAQNPDQVAHGQDTKLSSNPAPLQGARECQALGKQIQKTGGNKNEN